MDPMDLNYDPDACYDDGTQCQKYANDNRNTSATPPVFEEPTQPAGAGSDDDIDKDEDGVTTVDPGGDEEMGSTDPTTGEPSDTNNNTSY